METQFAPQLRSIRATLEERRSERAALKRERDEAKANLAASNAAPAALTATAEFKAAEAIMGRLESLDEDIRSLEAAELGVLRLIGANTARPNSANGPTDSPDGTSAASGWAHAARTIDLAAGVNRADMLATALMQAAVVPTPANPLTPSVSAPFVEQGRDQRVSSLYATLPRQSVSNELAVSDWRASGRTVVEGSTTGIERMPMDTSEKARLSLGVEHVDEAIKVFAVVIDQVPVKLLAAIDGFEAYLRAEGQYVIDQALNAHTAAQILASAPVAGAVGPDLIAQSRHAVGVLRGVGFTPNVIALSPAQAEALDLTTSGADGQYVFSIDTGAGSIWKLAVVEVNDLDAPLVFDSASLGVLYAGTGTVVVDPYTGLSTNEVRLRVEISALAHIRQPYAAYVIDGSG